MTSHIVRQGECLSSLAARSGLGDWKQLYDHPANADLKKKRPNPNVLAPGDKVEAPDLETKTVSAATGRIHTYVVKLQKVKLRIAIVSWSGEPYQGKRFLVNAGAREMKGTTAADGMVEVEVPATQSAARLRVWLDDAGEDASPTIDRELAIGHIDPIEMLSGVRKRLSNLGYRCPVSNEPIKQLDDPTLVAVRSFRVRNGLREVDSPAPKDGQDDASSDENAAPASDSGPQPGVSVGPTEEEVANYLEQSIDDAFREKLLAAYEGSAGA
jgi:hypothetical protein